MRFRLLRFLLLAGILPPTAAACWLYWQWAASIGLAVEVFPTFTAGALLWLAAIRVLFEVANAWRGSSNQTLE